jgi:hypothetical protein
VQVACRCARRSPPGDHRAAEHAVRCRPATTTARPAARSPRRSGRRPRTRR